MTTSATMDDTAAQGSNGARRLGKNAQRDSKRNSRPEFANLITDVEDLLHKVGHIADSEVALVRERLQKKIASAKETLSAEGMQLAATARRAAGVTDDYVHENPWKSTGLAALAGAILALVIFRR